MNIALIGYGRMGREIGKAALARGHSIGLVIDKDNLDELTKEKLSGIDAAIDFSLPDQAPGNIIRCLEAGTPVVSGTTGWLDRIEEIKVVCQEYNGTFLYSSNFSVGVNLLFYLNRRLSELMNAYTDYSVEISEIHHTAKLDSPSGTAISLANGIIEGHDAYTSWDESEKGSSIKDNKDTIPVFASREGDVPGTHEVKWTSGVDCLSLRHEAFGRQGFALGAVMAAEFVRGRKGFLTMGDMLGF